MYRKHSKKLQLGKKITEDVNNTENEVFHMKIKGQIFLISFGH